MRRGIAVAAILLLGVPREHAPAGIPLVDSTGSPYRWDLASEQPNVVGGKVTFFPDAVSLHAQTQGQMAPVVAIRTAVHEWEIGTTAIRFQEDASRAASGLNGADRVNWIGWVRGGLDRLTLGATTVTRDGTKITDMDVALNARDWSWDTFTPGRTAIADIEGLVTHEWGHALGCDHVPLRTSTMYAFTDAGVISLRTIAADDRALVGSMYPNPAFQQTTGAVTGTVDLAGSSNDRAIHVVAVPVASAEPEASALTRPDGSFRIDGLPAGVYRLVAAPCLPLQGSMNSFWTSGTASFLPSVLREGPANPGAIVPVVVAAGQTTNAPAMGVANTASPPFEPNDDMAHATAIEVGQAACARFESGGDEDWFTFSGAAGQRISINVLSWGLGSSADPAVRLLNAAATAVALQDDVRSPVFLNQIEGQDLDVRIVGAQLPADGTYFVRLLDQRAGPGANGFYALMLTPSSDAPSTALTTLTATPPRLDADGVSTAKLVVRPRRETGEDVGPGADVQLTHTGGGTVTAVLDAGDGSYTATLTAPATAGDDRFTVTVKTAEGTATILDAATFVYLGPVDAAKSSFAVVPRRIDADGAAQAVVTIVPRDARGEGLGTGRRVTFGLTAPAGASLSGPADLGDGSYGDTLTAPAQHGTGQVTATVDGVDAGITAQVAFGFDLAGVLAAAKADVAVYAATPGLPKKAAQLFAQAQTALDAALASAATGGTKATARALAKTLAALGKVQSGLAKAKVALDDPGTARDLSRAVREAALSAIANAVVVTARDQRDRDAAGVSVTTGDSAFAGGAFAKAAAKWRAAFGRVQRLQPK